MIDRPALTVITPISMDHEAYLGDTLAAIAGEKAGILKRGVPCIVGPQHDAAMEVIEAAAPPRRAASGAWPALACDREHGRLVYQDETGLRDLPLPNLPGHHQIENAGAALAVLRQLGAGDAACEAAVTRAVWPARMQRLVYGPLIDAAPRPRSGSMAGITSPQGRRWRGIWRPCLRDPRIWSAGC